MASRRPIVIDGRIIFRSQCRGIARALIGWVEKFPCDANDGAVKILIQRNAVSPFDLTGVEKRVEFVETDLPVVALHRVAALRHLLNSLDAGVIFSPYHPLAPLAAPCPVVSVVHDCIWEEDPLFAGGRARQLAFELLTRLALARVSRVVVPSLATANAVHRHYPHVATEVVPNGVTFRRAGTKGDAGVEETRRTFGLPTRYLLHVGARRPHKNQELLLKVLAELDPSISLVLVGDRDPRVEDNIDQRIQQLGLTDRVLALQKVPDRYLPAVYEAASVFVFPSLIEGYGIPPLEAMAVGTPVVASAIPAVAEVCRDAATLVSPYDPDGWVEALNRIFADPAAADTLRSRGIELARESTWERGAATLYELLRTSARIL